MSKYSIEYSRSYREKHRDKNRAASLAWRKRNKEKANAARRAYSQRPEVKAREKERRSMPEAKLKNAARQRKYRTANRDYVKELQRKNYEKLRLKALSAYGGKCICCGESHSHFLSIDHINGGGKKDRRDRGCGTGGGNWYRLLLKQHLDHVQILCYNCNMAKGHYGQCPHQIKKA
jgi:hypothetical protein